MSTVSNPSLNKKIFSVSELNRQTKNLLNQYFPHIQVEGEISNLSQPSSGHCYFSLKDSKAQIRCAMFRSQMRNLGFIPENGKQVIITAQVSLYEARGDYQLIVDKMQQRGEGNLQIAFDKLKNKLQQQGLFEQTLKQTLPAIPRKIGIITSPTGAAIHDILTVLKRRFPSVPVIIYPSAVQGDLAKFEIISAIELANRLQQVDILLMARGGGSLEDLWAFNEESVALAIVKSKIPIITGIGHEVDFTIADFVADLRAPTPSAAAEHAVPDRQVWLSQFQSYRQHLQQLIDRIIQQQQQTLKWLASRLQQQHPGQQLQRHAQTLDNLEIRLSFAMQARFKHAKNQLNIQHSLLMQSIPSAKIKRFQQQQHFLYFRLTQAIENKLERLKKKQLALIQTLNAVNPLATLERGYAIVSDLKTSAVISSSQQLNLDDQIKIRFADGQAISQIKEIKHD